MNIKIILLTCFLPKHNPKSFVQVGLLWPATQSLLSVRPLTCLPCTKILVILGARLSTSLVKRLAASRTTDLVGKKTEEQSWQHDKDSQDSIGSFFSKMQSVQIRNFTAALKGMWFHLTSNKCMEIRNCEQGPNKEPLLNYLIPAFLRIHTNFSNKIKRHDFDASKSTKHLPSECNEGKQTSTNNSIVEPMLQKLSN